MSAPACSANTRARAGSRSETARKPTAGCLAASRARNVPMRPAPTTAMPILSCFIPRPRVPCSRLRHLPRRDLAPIAAHPLLVDIDPEPGTIGNFHVSARDAYRLRRHVLGEAFIGQREPPGDLRQYGGDVGCC